MEWDSTTNEGFYQFQASPGNKERYTNPQVKVGVSGEGEFGSGHGKTVLMDINKDIFTLVQ